MFLAATHLSVAYYGRTSNLDGPALMWTALALASLVEDGPRSRIWFAVFAAAAVATKDQAYASFLFLVPLVWRRPRALAAGALVWALLGGALINPTGFWARLREMTGPASGDYRAYTADVAGRIANLVDLGAAQSDFFWSWPVVILCWGGVVLAARRRAAWLPFLSGAGSVVGFALWVGRCEPRFVLPFGFFLSLYGGVAAAALSRHRAAGLAIGFLAAAGVLTLVAAALATTVYFARDPYEKNMRNLLSDNAELRRARARLARIDAAFSSDLSGGFVVVAPDREAARRAAAAMRAVDAARPPKERLFGGIRTLDDALPQDQPEKLRLLAEIRNQLDAGAELRPPDGLRTVTDADVPEILAWRFTEKDGTRGRLILADTSPNYDTWKIFDLIRFAGEVRRLDLGDGVILGGSMFVFADVLRSMETDGPRATLAALLGAVLAVGLVVGFGRGGQVTLFCGVTGTLLMIAAAGAVGLKVSFLDFVALPITVGIGIDYAVNIVARAQAGEALGHVLATTGGAVTMCSFTTIAGYASLLLSANRGIRSFGAAATLGEIACLLVALALAPALLSTRR